VPAPCAEAPGGVRRRRLAALLLVTLLSLIGLAACSSPANPGGVVIRTTQGSSQFLGYPVPYPYEKPDVVLTDTAGNPYNPSTDMLAPVGLVFFGYTHCPDVCLIQLALMASALRQVDAGVREQTEVIYITTDPARDTSAVLRDYLAAFDLPGAVGLTGDLATIKTAAEALDVPIEDGKRLPSGGYVVAHGAQIIGFGPDGTAPVIWTQGTAVRDLAHDVELLAQLPDST
jgi:protein SCO1/2